MREKASRPKRCNRVPICVGLLSEGMKLILRKENSIAAVCGRGGGWVCEGEGGLYLLIRFSLGLMTGSPLTCVTLR